MSLQSFAIDRPDLCWPYLIVIEPLAKFFRVGMALSNRPNYRRFVAYLCFMTLDQTTPNKNKKITHYGRLFERAGVERQPGKSSHAIRITHATLLNDAGGNASISLGHSSPHTTFTHYIDPRSKLEENFKLLPNLSEPAGETLEPAPDEPAIEPPTEPPPLADVVATEPGEPRAASVGPDLASESVTLGDFLHDYYLPNRRSVNIRDIQNKHTKAIERFGLTIGVVPKISDLTFKNLAWHIRKTAKDLAEPTAFKDAKKLVALWKYAFTKQMARTKPPREPEWRQRYAKEAEKAK